MKRKSELALYKRYKRNKKKVDPYKLLDKPKVEARNTARITQT